jgi:caffeoyl-CoA O-methyltransferase
MKKMDFNRVNTYIESLYESGDQLHRKAFIQATEMKDFTPVVDDDVARFLKLLIRVTRPLRILEIGTSIGFSTASMASILKGYGGKITSIELDSAAVNQAWRNFDRLGVAGVIDLRQGDALEIVPALEPGYDIIFQDVHKRLYTKLLPDCLRLLKPGGILLADDTLFPVMDIDPIYDDQIEAIREFNQVVVNTPQLDSTLLPLGDGIIFAVKRY